MRNGTWAAKIAAVVLPEPPLPTKVSSFVAAPSSEEATTAKGGCARRVVVERETERSGNEKGETAPIDYYGFN